MRRVTDLSLPVEVNRSYMKALRDLLGLGQYTMVRLMKDDRIIRESEVSCIEGKIGYSHLWDVYASYCELLIKECDRSETIKNIMMTLLDEWRKA